MTEPLVWALRCARDQTLALIADVPPERLCDQCVPGERHPAWILGHLLLADMYLLSLLEVQELSPDFSILLQTYGPGATPTSNAERYGTKDALTRRLTQVNELRLSRIRDVTAEELERPLPDRVLAQAQPTFGHHLQGLVLHEGYHGGQLSSWRKAHGLPSVRWVIGPDGDLA